MGDSPSKPWRRLGLAGDTLAADTVARTLRRVGPDLSLPPDLAALLLRALRWEAAERQAGWEERCEALIFHYLDQLPRFRRDQLRPEAPHAELFHTRFAPGERPALEGGVGHLFTLLTSADLDPSQLFGAGRRGQSAAAWLRARPALADIYRDTYFGGVMPILYGYPGDVAAVQAEVVRTGDFAGVVDQRFAGPIVHELSHLGRARVPLAPVYLDECVAGFLGVMALPTIEIPAPATDNAMFLASWFTQVGRALFRVGGRRAVIRAHAGAAPWEDALPPSFIAWAAAAGWADYAERGGVNFLGDTARPTPWLKALYLARAGRPIPAGLDAAEAVPWPEIPAGPLHDDDAPCLAAAIEAMMLVPRLDGAAFRVTRQPARGSVVVDAVAGHVRRSGWEEPLEGRPLTVHVPPPICAGLRAAGHSTVTLDRLAPGDGAACAAECIAKIGVRRRVHR